ncbi:MAG: reverse transcriptase/maturase family protein [bacterium]
MPHSFGGRFERMVRFESLLAAFRQARRGKRGRPDVAAFELNLEPGLLRLQRELVSGEWRPGPYRNFYVEDQKRRLITAAPFRDRVVHHALHAILEPVFETGFIHDSYACRRGKGQHRALARYQRWARGSRFVLRGDIRKFYPSVDHGILRRQLDRRIRDRRVLALCELILASGAGILEPEYELAWFPGDDLFTPLARVRGLPIGNLTSQFFGNVYLNKLDHFVKEELRCRRYLRYMDDFAVFADNPSALHGVRRDIERFLWDLRLTLHEARTRVWRTGDGAEFLGFRVWPGHRLVRKATAVRYARALRKLAAGSGAARNRRVRESLTAWLGHSRWGNSYRLNRQVLGRAGLLAG